uniref:THAP-type domain-containing protein n=2 Tax=Neogobius melanostomus TaxID=47308 RepID=A0A8C6SJG8_9GOBI
MVTTKHCCFGVCRSDSRYGHRDHMKGVVFIPFPKPRRALEKCERWVRACKREGFKAENVTKDTYICSLHFVGGKGPTLENPDPIPATATVQEERKARKRKAPIPRNEDTVGVATINRKRLTCNNITPTTSRPCSHGAEEESTNLHINDTTTAINTTIDAATALMHLSSVSDLTAQVMSDEDGIEEVDKSCQTDVKWDKVMKLKLEAMILKTELYKRQNQNVAPQQKHMFSIDDVKDDDKQFRFYTGLTWLQFMAFWNFLGPSRAELSYHKSSVKSETSSRERRLDPINQLFLTIIRLRTGLPQNDLAYRFGISVSSVSKIVTTWIQFMYLRFSILKKPMFVTRDIVAKNLPLCFQKLKGIRTIIDCTEFFVKQASNFERQGHLYPSLKSHGTYKVLIGVSPTGAVMFVSDAYEGSISDVGIVKQSGFLDHLEAGDLVLANRGFPIRDILSKKGVHLNIPPFMNGRKKLTPEEDIYSKQIERVQVHVERCVERIKKFRLLSKVTLQPVLSQMVFVAGCLVNFQELERPQSTDTQNSPTEPPIFKHLGY